jgi:hypothetical protein
MAISKFYTPLRTGFIIVAIAYFLITLHAILNFSWIGEWEAFDGTLRLIVLAEDISASIGVAFRLVASATALITITVYFVRKNLQKNRLKKLLRTILVCEALYWLGLLTTTVLTLSSTLNFTVWRVNGHISTLPASTSLIINVLPLLVESVVLPAVLLKLAYELGPAKQTKRAIKWGLIAGTLYILVFWLTGTSIWITTVLRQGTRYLTSYPENLLSFLITSIGMLVLTIFSAYFARKSIKLQHVERINKRTVGAIVTMVGLFFFWNYLSWILFGKNETWSYWYLWFLGNLNLWLLSTPMVGLPLLFDCKPHHGDIRQVDG